ncbi:MAG: alpha/beta hydrolase [Clostridiales bacterium]|nr:alpha/beta hydrolase [Clostridiales bacterium]
MQRAIELDRGGLMLRGMLHRPDNGVDNVPLAILFHGFTGNKMESHFMFVKLSRKLEEAGIASLRFDFLGSGESDGDFQDMTFAGELRDAEIILEYAKSLDWVDKGNIFIVGLSMGGAIASVLAGKYSNDIKRLCLWGPAGNMPELIKRRAQELIDSKELDSEQPYYDLGGLLLGKRFIDDIENTDIYGEASLYEGDVFIVHGEKDMAVPLSASYEYLSIYGDRAKLYIIEDADHTFNKYEWESLAIGKTADFLKGEK